MTVRASNVLNLVPAWIASAVHGGHELFTRWRSRRSTYDLLMSLDDRHLQDIGLTRGDIWSAANGDFRKSAANKNSATRDAA